MLRFEVLFKKFYPRINLTTLFPTKTYTLNTMQPFSGQENRPLELKQQNLKNLSKAAFYRNLNFKIQNFKKLAQKTPGAKIGGGGLRRDITTATAAARDRRKNIFAQIMFFSY
jgi:hypothetical protein